MLHSLVKDLAAARTRAKTLTLRQTRGLTAKQVGDCKREIAKVDHLISEAFKADPIPARRMEILVGIPGLGEVTAFTPLIEMPELGTLTGKQAASLAGLAPVARQSGKWRGGEHISGG